MARIGAKIQIGPFPTSVYELWKTVFSLKFTNFDTENEISLVHWNYNHLHFKAFPDSRGHLGVGSSDDQARRVAWVQIPHSAPGFSTKGLDHYGWVKVYFWKLQKNQHM